MFPLLSLPTLILLLLPALTHSQSFFQFEFCYILRGPTSSTTGGYGVATHGYLFTNTSYATTSSGQFFLNIYDSQSTRTVTSVLGQTHVETLRGIVVANNRVDDNLYLNGSAVDGSGIQLPIAGTADLVAGVGTMLAYDQTAQPFVFVTNPVLGLVSQLNSNINLLYTSGQYGERLDAGGATIIPASSRFYLQPYNPAAIISNCSLSITGPFCTNYPQTPPTGSVLFNVTLNTAWTSIPSTYIADVLTALTKVLTANTQFASQSQYLGLYLFSCYPLFTAPTLANPRLAFYLNAQSATAMSLSLTTIVPTIYSALQPGSTVLTPYLLASEANLIAAQGCPFVFNGATYPGINGCSAGGGSGSVSGTGSTGGVGGGGGGSSLSSGAIAGIVVGSVVGAFLICLILLCVVRPFCAGGQKIESSAGKTRGTAGSTRFEDEDSTQKPTDGVELA